MFRCWRLLVPCVVALCVCTAAQTIFDPLLQATTHTRLPPLELPPTNWRLLPPSQLAQICTSTTCRLTLVTVTQGSAPIVACYSTQPTAPSVLLVKGTQTLTDTISLQATGTLHVYGCPGPIQPPAALVCTNGTEVGLMVVPGEGQELGRVVIEGVGVGACTGHGVLVGGADNVWLLGARLDGNGPGGEVEGGEGGDTDEVFMYLQNGGGLFADGNVVVLNSVLRNNRGYRGGAIYSERGSIYVNSSTFDNNTGVVGSGGALLTSRGNITIENSVFVGNVATSGGAVSSAGGVTLENSTFTANEASRFVPDSAKFTGKDNNHGGAVKATGNITAVNCKFVNNTALKNAGALYSIDYIILLQSNASFNSARGNGGVVVSRLGVNIVGPATYESNVAGEVGGVAWVPRDDTREGLNEVSDCTFIGNSASELGEGQGGGVLYLMNLHARNSVFSNSSAKNGGALFVEGRAFLDNCTFGWNMATSETGNGGGAFAAQGITSSNTHAYRNKAYQGGAFFSAADVQVIGGLFEENSGRQSGGGGAITASGYANVTGAVFRGNSAGTQSLGSAIFAVGGLLATTSTFTSNGVTVWGDQTEKTGQGTVATDQGAPMYLIGCTFSQNHCQQGGCAVSASANLHSEHCIYVNNVATAGGIAVGGGAISTLGNLFSAGDVFENNQAAIGGAVFVEGAASIQEGSFKSNRATHAGGALYSQAATITATDFSINTAPTGGAVYVQDSSSVQTCQFSQNSAKGGGALWANQTIVVESCSFVRNNATEGGAIMSAVGPVQIEISTFTANSAVHGGAVWFQTNPSNDALSIQSSNFTENVGSGDLEVCKQPNRGYPTPPPCESSSSGDNTVMVALVATGVVLVVIVAAAVGIALYVRHRTPGRIDYNAIVRKIRAQHTWVDADSSEAQALLSAVQARDGLVPRSAFAVLETLGKGQFGSVARGVVFVSGKAVVCAVKESIQTDAQARANFSREIDLLKGLSHPNIVRIIGVCDPSAEAPAKEKDAKKGIAGKVTWFARRFGKNRQQADTEEEGEGDVDGGGCVLLLMEYMDGGDLRRYVATQGDIPFARRMWFAKELAAALDYLAGQGIVHRDIAARNVLLGSPTAATQGHPRVKLTDLGLARLVAGPSNEYVRGGEGGDLLPVRWMAPEAVFGHTYSEKSDVWAFGVTVWEIEARGETPYGFLNTPQQVMQSIQHGLRLRQPIGCPSTVFSVLADCWQADLTARPTFASLREFFEGRYAASERDDTPSECLHDTGTYIAIRVAPKRTMSGGLEGEADYSSMKEEVKGVDLATTQTLDLGSYSCDGGGESSSFALNPK